MLTLNRASLAAALRALAPIVAGGGDPRFKHVLLDATGGVLLTAISPDYALVGERAVEWAGEDYPDESSALIPHKWMLEAAESLPGDTVRLELGDSRATLSAGRSRMTRPTLPAEELVLPAPLSDLAERCTLTGGDLAYGLAQVAYALPSDTTRPALNAVLLEDTGDRLWMVATSGRQMAVHVLDDDGGHGVTAPFRLSLPEAALPVLRAYFGKDERVVLSHGGQTPGGTAYAAFAGERGSLRVRLPSGDEYPNVIPLLDQPITALVPMARADLLAAATRAVIQCGRRDGALEGSPVTFRNADGTAHLLAEDLAEAFDAEGDDTEFRFMPERMKAACEKVRGERVVLERRGHAMVYLRGDGPDLYGMARINDGTE